MRRTVLLCLCAGLVVQAAVSAQGPHTRQVRRHRRAIANAYIVTLAGDEDPEAVGLETAVLRDGHLKHVFRHGVHGFAIHLTDAQATALANDPRVQSVEEDAEVHASGTVEADAPWGLDRLDQRRLPLDGSFHYVDLGVPVYVHVIDTGVRTSHAEFAGRAFTEDDAVGDGGNGGDCNGHGTHVAGIIAGEHFGVAKRATILSHRVLDCRGTGSVSDLIAAVDAVTADTRRPAIANLSLGTVDPSDALDDAVRRAIAEGITVVIAAGNDSVDASTRSPARVKEAITVGAVDDADTRAYFSNYGSALDLFAPGVSIQSAWYASDSATATMSGTSMAAPYVTGVLALFLAQNGDKSPLDAAAAVTTGATRGAVVDAGLGSPNRLLYSQMVAVDRPLVRVSHPNGGEKAFTGTPFTIEWDATGTRALKRFDVLASTDNGATFNAVAGCSAISGARRSCTWAAPGPVSTTVLIRVVVTDASGASTTDTSDGRFSIVSGTGSITVTSPNAAMSWAHGSVRDIKWTHNLGAASYVRVELSRDGGATFPETLVVMKNTSASSGSFRWRSTTPDTMKAVIRVSWTSGPVSDTGDGPFAIAAPYITLSGITASTNWGYGTTQRISWTTNLGPYDLLDIYGSRDTGATYSTAVVNGVAAGTKSTDVTAPSQSANGSARVRLVWSNAPDGAMASVASVPFTVARPFVKLTSPNGGEMWTSGKSGSIHWTSNLGYDKVRIDLSRDGGSTYALPVSSGTTARDGGKSVTVSTAWATTKARLRVTALDASSTTDRSDAVFQIR